MKRREILQATAVALSNGIPSWAFSQGIGSLKPGKPYAGTEINLRSEEHTSELQSH